MKLNLNFLSPRKKSVSKKIPKTFIRVEKVVIYLMLIEWYWIDNNAINSRNIYWPIVKRKCTTQWIVMKKFTNILISAPQQKTLTSETIAQSRTSFVFCKKTAKKKKKKKEKKEKKIILIYTMINLIMLFNMIIQNVKYFIAQQKCSHF